MLPEEFMLCAQLSLASYRKAGATLEGFEHVHLSEDDVQADLLWDADKVYLVFRGTESFRDAIRDINVLGDDNTHRGFRKGFTSLQWTLSDKLQAIDGLDNRTITITGHSMGGALAVLAAYQLPVRAERVVTFGAPKVGGKAFGRLYRNAGNTGNTFQFVNGADQVPRMQFFRRHVGTCLLLSEGGAIVNPRSWKLLATFLLARPSRRITDHLMMNYIRSLENANRP